MVVSHGTVFSVSSLVGNPWLGTWKFLGDLGGMKSPILAPSFGEQLAHCAGVN